MKAVVVNFRGGYKQQKASNQIVIHVSGVESRDAAAKLVNKEVVWSSPAGLAIKGKIVAPHGNKGVVRAIFEKGIPGQALGTEIQIE